jgi:hypothetical protein
MNDWPETRGVIEVSWFDSASTSGWQHRYENLHALECKSVGYLHSQDDEVIRLLQSINADGAMGELIIIPRVNIRVIRTLSFD